MDQKIDGIFSSYDDNEESVVKYGEENSEEDIPLPKTADEWLARMGFTVWPIQVEEEKNLHLTPEDVGTGSLEDIINALAAHAPLDLSMLDDVLSQVEELESKVNFFASKILNMDVTPNAEIESDEEIRKKTPNLVNTYRKNDETILESAKRYQEREALGASLKAKCVEKTTYYGFIANELSPLPCNLESQQLLNRVTKIQNFTQPFKNVWKKVILSQASVAVFQDAFWWVFCHHFQPEQPKDMIFSRIADSFVALLFSVPAAFKDRFFLHYPNCLAQALYSAFCEAFPDSYKILDANFKTFLLDTVCEWVSGVRLPPMSWKSWQLECLEPIGFQKIEESRKSVAPKTLWFDADAVLGEEHLSSPSERSKLARSPSPLSHVVTQESHPLASGPDFAKVKFNILGHSPLVSHFLQMKGLKVTDTNKVKKIVGRTEIAELPHPRPTYQDIIDECKRNSQILSQRYHLVLQMSAEESQRIQKQKQEVIANINQMQAELSTKHSDLKTLSERIYDLILYSDYT